LNRTEFETEQVEMFQTFKKAVFQIQIRRIRQFLGLADPDSHKTLRNRNTVTFILKLFC
jgi:hypothetical protein